jgi:hypothetical protein
MVKLHAGNCQLKPSQKRQLASWLKRTVHLGERVGNFVLTISVRQVTRGYEMRASVRDAAGRFDCRSRGHTWRDVCRAIARMLSVQLRQQREAMSSATAATALAA